MSYCFLLNLSIEPYFCALVTDNTSPIFKTWQTGTQGSSIIWTFCQSHLSELETCRWIGGITGPGGFSSLRVTAEILEILQEKYNVPLRSVRADKVAQTYLERRDTKSDIILNAFGNHIFHATQTSQELELIDLEKASQLYPQAFLGFLPPHKQTSWGPTASSCEDITIQDLINASFDELNNRSDQTLFLPYYGHDGI